MTEYLQLQPDADYDSSIFNQDIEDSNYTFDTRFNYRLDLWILTILDPDGDVLASSPLVNNTPLLRLYNKDELFSGDVILVDDLDSKVICDRDSLNVKYTLLLSLP